MMNCEWLFLRVDVVSIFRRPGKGRNRLKPVVLLDTT
jgi:hypothetical protein